MIKKAPEYKTDFTANFESLKNELLTLDRTMEQITINASDISILASQPTYQYLARRYQINVKEVLWGPDTDPGMMEWQKFEKSLLNHQAHWMIWPEEPLPSIRKRLARLQVNTAIFSPCSTKPDQGDFMTVMQKNIENLQPFFKQ